MNLTTFRLNQITEYLRNQPVLKAYIFGSYARKMEENHSDIDILIEIDYSQMIGLHFIQIRLDLEQILHKKVDLVCIDALSTYIRPFVEQEKELIYEKI